MVGVRRRLSAIKLGGSLISFKERALTVNYEGIDNVARQLRKVLLEKSAERLILVHGGGSFGHYFAKRYSLSEVVKVSEPKGISQTSFAMIKLHSVILERLEKHGLPCKTLLAPSIVDSKNRTLTTFGKEKLRDIVESGLIPISFGDVLVSAKGSCIISGDLIIESIARSIPLDRVIFAMDVDGIYTSSDRQQLISELSDERAVSTSSSRYDVTGGIKAKIETGYTIARMGTSVFYLNGSKQRRLQNLLLGRPNVICTVIHGRH
jgi:isopentenyl phosphate kinase